MAGKCKNDWQEPDKKMKFVIARRTSKYCTGRHELIRVSDAVSYTEARKLLHKLYKGVPKTERQPYVIVKENYLMLKEAKDKRYRMIEICPVCHQKFPGKLKKGRFWFHKIVHVINDKLDINDRIYLYRLLTVWYKEQKKEILR